MRMTTLPSLFIAALALVVFASVGCEQPTSGNGENPSGDNHVDHEPFHPPHGPNHGHVFDIDSAEYQGEWKQDKVNNITRMFLLDGKAEKSVAVKVDSFIVRPQVGKGDVQFVLTAEEPDENGASTTYMIDDKDLTIAISLGVDIEIKIGDKTYKSQIPAHKPLDH